MDSTFKSRRTKIISVNQKAASETATEAKAINVEFIDSVAIEDLMDRAAVEWIR